MCAVWPFPCAIRDIPTVDLLPATTLGFVWGNSDVTLGASIAYQTKTNKLQTNTTVLVTMSIIITTKLAFPSLSTLLTLLAIGDEI